MTRVLVLIASGLLATTAAADPKGVTERTRLDVQPAGAPISQLMIENALGDVRVEGYDGKAVLIEARKHAPDEEALDRLRVSLVPGTDGSVRIVTAADRGPENRAVARSAVRIDLIVRAPRGARVDAAASTGSLEVTNMDAGGELDTASGPISVRNVSGDVLTHTMSGRTSLTQVFGSVDAQSLTSDLELDTIAGEQLVATATRGTISGRRVRVRQIELTTTQGKIVLEAEIALRGHVVIASVHGDVDVRFRRTGPLRIRARAVKVNLGVPSQETTDGWIEAQLGQLTGGRPSAAVEMRSRHGAVNVAF
ncbi:MAG: DUF4097 family beta strand repeat-containing protein [Kofleriaceae bacterium]